MKNFIVRVMAINDAPFVKRARSWIAAGVIVCAAESMVCAQVVTVTMGLDTNRVAVGGSTVLRVYAEIVPAQKENSDRIFSWYVDQLNLNGSFARGEYAQLAKPTSDNDAQTSSPGTTDGAHRRAIYDTFLNRPDAGRTNRIELFNVPVTGVASGATTFRVQAGTTATNLSSDFIVAPKGGGDPMFGGDYSNASIALEVGSGATVEPPRLAGARSGRNLAVTFPFAAGRRHFIESRTGWSLTDVWVTQLGPTSSGSVILSNDAPAIFFRLRVE